MVCTAERAEGSDNGEKKLHFLDFAKNGPFLHEGLAERANWIKASV